MSVGSSMLVSLYLFNISSGIIPFAFLQNYRLKCFFQNVEKKRPQTDAVFYMIETPSMQAVYLRDYCNNFIQATNRYVFS